MAACHSNATPSGQVVAVVDGIEITASQLKQALEAQSSGPNGVSNYQETTELAGTTVYVSQERTFFNREMNIQVNVSQQTDYGEQVWHGKIFSCGTTSDLREMVDYLLIYAFKYFGANTKKNVYETHNEWCKPLEENY